MYPNVLHSFYNCALAITPDKLREIDQFLKSKAAGAPQPGAAAISAGPRDGVQMVGRVALLPLFGVIAQRMNMIMQCSGGTSTEMFGRAFDSLVADKQVKAIVMVVDSPGGAVFGLPELAQKIYDARGEKRVVAIADSMAASAAFWLASQAAELVVTPGGMIGSVGVVAAHVDESKAEELAGVKTTLVYAGQFKVETDPSQPLSEDARSELQRSVDAYYDMFLAALSRGRGLTENRIRNDFGQGRMVMAKEAVSRGMADRVATLDQVLTRLNAGTAQGAAARARAIEVWR